MLSATSHIGLEFLTKFLNMSKLQNRLILLYQSLPLQFLDFRKDFSKEVSRFERSPLFIYSVIIEYMNNRDCLEGETSFEKPSLKTKNLLTHI